MWPGFGENIRVLKWMFERIDDKAPAEKTPIGFVPTKDALDLTGIDVPNLEDLFKIDAKKYLQEAEQLESYFYMFGDWLPQGIRDELDHLKNRLLAT